MRQFIVLVGNNGTGKTFYSKENFPPDYKIVRPDDYSGDFDTIQRQIFYQIESTLTNNQTVVIDGLNLERSFRKQLLYFTIKYPDCRKIIYDFGPGDQSILQKLTLERPFKTQEEWTRIFFKNKKLYEKPMCEEGYDEIIEINNNFA